MSVTFVSLHQHNVTVSRCSSSSGWFGDVGGEGGLDNGSWCTPSKPSPAPLLDHWENKLQEQEGAHSKVAEFYTWLDFFVVNKNSLKGEQDVSPPLICMAFHWKQWITVFQQKRTISYTRQRNTQLPLPISL